MFAFKQFALDDARCAMKVGTDGVLVGAACSLPQCPAPRVLDAGCGCGLIALMVAQRCPGARVTAVEIDPQAAASARANVAASPWDARVEVVCGDVAAVTGRFDLVVSNPPFFNETLRSPSGARALSRHGSGFDAAALIGMAPRLLAPGGSLSFIAPWQRLGELALALEVAGLHPRRRVDIAPKPGAQPHRVLLEASLAPGPYACSRLAVGSEQYKLLTHDFYLR